MLRRQEALNRGYSDDEIRRLYTRGEWQRIGRGAYLSASMYSALGEEERHRFLIDSTIHAVSDDAVLSHQSATVVYGLPLWKRPLDRVHVTRNGALRAHRRARGSGGRALADPPGADRDRPRENSAVRAGRRGG
nr:hypothetical protein JVH1_6521 [Rhodococcus sp. JVH1]